MKKFLSILLIILFAFPGVAFSEGEYGNFMLRRTRKKLVEVDGYVGLGKMNSGYTRTMNGANVDWSDGSTSFFGAKITLNISDGLFFFGEASRSSVKNASTSHDSIGEGNTLLHGASFGSNGSGRMTDISGGLGLALFSVNNVSFGPTIGLFYKNLSMNYGDNKQLAQVIGGGDYNYTTHANSLESGGIYRGLFVGAFLDYRRNEDHIMKVFFKHYMPSYSGHHNYTGAAAADGGGMTLMQSIGGTKASGFNITMENAFRISQNDLWLKLAVFYETIKIKQLAEHFPDVAKDGGASISLPNSDNSFSNGAANFNKFGMSIGLSFM